MSKRWVVAGALVLLVAAALCAQVVLAKDKTDDRVLSRVTFIHYRRGYGKPPWAGGGSGGKQDQGSYAYIAKGARWKTTEEFRLNLTAEENVDGTLDGLITDAVAAGMDEWETPGGASLSIYGPLAIDDSVTYDDASYRGYNTISFGPHDDPDVIGITTVWGYFGGPVGNREITEAHVLLNDAFLWGDASADSDDDGSPDAYLMDIQSIVTHELGHVAGMGDLYDTRASEETMYGYSSEGEMKKRDLYKGDIAGVTKLYE